MKARWLYIRYTIKNPFIWKILATIIWNWNAKCYWRKHILAGSMDTYFHLCMFMTLNVVLINQSDLALKEFQKWRNSSLEMILIQIYKIWPDGNGIRFLLGRYIIILFSIGSSFQSCRWRRKKRREVSSEPDSETPKPEQDVQTEIPSRTHKQSTRERRYLVVKDERPRTQQKAYCFGKQKYL